MKCATRVAKFHHHYSVPRRSHPVCGAVNNDLVTTDSVVS